MPCGEGQGVFHTSLACQYHALEHRLFEMNSFSTAALCGIFLAPACAIFGNFAQRLKLPRITGYLVAGVATGPYALRLLSKTSVAHLWFVDQACLSVIALAAGAELQWEQLDKIKRQVRAAGINNNSGFMYTLQVARLCRTAQDYVNLTAVHCALTMLASQAGMACFASHVSLRADAVYQIDDVLAASCR